MAGIIASSEAHPMVAGDTSASDVESGYVTAQQITLSTTPSGTVYVWGQAIPSGSTLARCALDSLTAASPRFTPDVPGEYVITCVVDSVTSYVIRLSVVALAASVATGAQRLLPLTDAQVPTPSTGVTLYYSSTQASLAIKTSAGAVRTVDTTAV